ncbi:MAG: hypothetical protein CSB44_09800 [Gammaproteobacteria bacterium]|nr:MAG: hypothetical protein CSB44_09800 [Gammaproteobacteria bacterium]PIE35560.1 MAG: hypothetical protein CSA54_05390 [Gammaproteobacteria bacterium]
MSEMTQRQKLEAARERLRGRLEAISKDYRRGLSADSEERATELENAETLAEIQRVTEQELARVEAELEDLDEDE